MLTYANIPLTIYAQSKLNSLIENSRSCPSVRRSEERSGWIKGIRIRDREEGNGRGTGEEAMRQGSSEERVRAAQRPWASM